MIEIRLAQAADAHGLAEIYRPMVESTPISFEVEAPDEHEMARRIERVHSLAPWLVGVRNGEVVGYVYASRHHERAAYRWSVDVSVYVRQDGRRMGLGRALYVSLFALLRLQGFYAAHAGITLPNAASVGLHESLGFRPIGVYPSVGFKQGAWYDVGYWQLELRERTGTPAIPLSVAEIRNRKEWHQAIQAGESLLRT